MRDDWLKTMWDNEPDEEKRKRYQESTAAERLTETAPGSLGLALLIMELDRDLSGGDCKTPINLLDHLFWRTDPGKGVFMYSLEQDPTKNTEARFFINCNDLFYWACADAEQVTRENIGQFEQACLDADEAGNAERGPSLFCCRVRKMRPQTPCYRGMSKEIAALFDAAGPVRDDPDGKGRS